ncbi:sensor histidine kinase [Opitutus terrae]|uniref:histidine kinase n=1 Tax=Opitutus terrae (strain DSM 11246 / JCM 15787 / PB90-1) TaxID=452637 RepID=B1ZXL2_OPITP|nr:PAS domain S-box protein [Opitutus terrae]ACB74234.1 multi-sensor signal transduction histidine kinase [Opitutus terrae PB90-1]
MDTQRPRARSSLREPGTVGQGNPEARASCHESREGELPNAPVVIRLALARPAGPELRPAVHVKVSIQRKIAAGFAVAALLLALITGAALRNAFRFDDTFRWVDHTHAVLREVEQVLANLLIVQSAGRGFVLSGSEDVLAPLNQSRVELAAAMEQLRKLTADNPIQQERLRALAPVTERVVQAMEEQLQQRRATATVIGGEAPVLLRTQADVDRAREIIRAIRFEEQRLLAERMRAAQRTAHGTVTASVAATVVALLFVLASVWLVRRDFGERVRSEQALRQSQQMFKRLFDNAPDATVQVDQQGRIVRANRQIEALFGWERGELSGRRIDELLPPRFASRHSAHLAAYFVAPRTRPMGVGLELFGRRRDGSEFPVDIMLSPLETEQGMQALAVIRDVTERKRIDEQIRRLNLDLQLQNARLELVNNELEAFSYSVSHDLRAPLRHIDGFASLLAKHAAGTLDEKGQRFITIISDAARRMGRLIDDLLTFSRMGRAQLETMTVDQNQLITDVIRDNELDRDQRIEWQLEPLPAVRADPAMLRQVWFNLLGNAVKYSARAEPPRIEVGWRSDPENSASQVFFVRDNGVGFDMRYAAKLFGVFQRLHAESEFEGTGIGLANVRRIIMRHGGRVWAESTPGAGATFFFSLPVNATSSTGS